MQDSRSTPMATPATPPAANLTAVNYEHTPNFVGLLEQLGVSLLVSTYQAGKLMTIGTNKGAAVIAFHNFERVMGLAVRPDRLAVGTRQQIWFLNAAPDLARRIQPAGQYDRCYLTRRAHFTGPILGHEMAWA